MSAASSRSDPDSPSGLAQAWQASLTLGIERRGARSVLARREHRGPLRVQKALYPEGDEVCQIMILHPPAGIAGGDELSIAVGVDTAAHAQLTTPGAGKWYRSKGPKATQNIDLTVAADAALEWLPQEVIVFDQAKAESSTTLSLAPGARAIGWDLVCLGRTASGERFRSGSFRQSFRLQRPDGTPLWQERLSLLGDDAALSSAPALASHSVFGTMWLAGIGPDPDLLEALRALDFPAGRSGVTALPEVTVLRVLSDSTEDARHYFEAAWTLARPHVLHRAAIPPRIWRT